MTDKKYPLVTVITPTYNRADLIRETIDSILAQDYPNFEYIVLDDGSADDTIAILESYGDKIIWDAHPNMGEARTVNKGFQMAKGDYVMVVSSDDPMYPNLLSTSVAFMEAHPDVLVAYPDWDIIDDNSQVTGHIQVREYDYANMVGTHHCVPGAGSLIRRKAIELEGGRDPDFRYVGDLEFWQRAGIHGPFARVPHTLAQFRIHGTSASIAQRGLIMADEHIRMMNKFYSRPDLPPAAKRVRRKAYSSANLIAGICVYDTVPGKAWVYFVKSLLWHPLNIRTRLPEERKLLVYMVFRAPLRRLYLKVRGKIASIVKPLLRRG